jgi:hypothetical protein
MRWLRLFYQFLKSCLMVDKLVPHVCFGIDSTSLLILVTANLENMPHSRMLKQEPIVVAHHALQFLGVNMFVP